MAAPFRHSNLASIVGSWPIIPSDSGATAPSPGTLDTNATLLGIRAEPVAGYDVSGKSFTLRVDGTDYSVVFASGPLTLDQVIAEINADVGLTVAFRDNKFLRLTSPTAGSSSSIKAETAATPTDVLPELGLFPGIEARGGDLTQADHIDPLRQVALPRQMAVMEGENFHARTFNRSIFQLGVNTGRTEGFLSYKRITTQEVKLVPGYTPTGVPTEEGVQLSGNIYAYVGSSTTPPPQTLEKLFSVVDPYGNELTKEVPELIGTSAGATWYVNAETGRQHISFASAAVFLDYDTGREHVRTSNAGAGALQDVLLKITEVISNFDIVVQNIDPVTGDTVAVSGTFDTDVIRVEVRKVQVTQVRDSQSGSRIEGVKGTRLGATAPTRVDLSNRIVFVGEDLVTAGVIPGDLVTWTGHGVSAPFDNNGDYRVLQVIDQETVEVLAEDWGPAYLNPDLTTGSAGTVTITSDGVFYKDPFLKFADGIPAGDGAIPDSGEFFFIRYLGMSNIRDALADPTSLSGNVANPIGAAQEIQRVLLAIVGPSITEFDEYLYDDHRNSLESLDYRLRLEHYEYDDYGPDGLQGHSGRHKAIRPDSIDMFPSTPGATLVLRGDFTDTTLGAKMEVRDEGDNRWMRLSKEGRFTFEHPSAPPTADDIHTYVYQGSGDAVGFEIQGSGNFSGILPILSLLSDDLDKRIGIGRSAPIFGLQAALTDNTLAFDGLNATDHRIRFLNNDAENGGGPWHQGGLIHFDPNGGVSGTAILNLGKDVSGTAGISSPRPILTLATGLSQTRVGVGVKEPEGPLHLRYEEQPSVGEPDNTGFEIFLDAIDDNNDQPFELHFRRALGEFSTDEQDTGGGDDLGAIVFDGWRSGFYRRGARILGSGVTASGTDLSGQISLQAEGRDFALLTGLRSGPLSGASEPTTGQAPNGMVVGVSNDLPSTREAAVHVRRDDTSFLDGHLFLHQEGGGHSRMDWRHTGGANDDSVAAGIASDGLFKLVVGDSGRVSSLNSGTPTIRIDPATGLLEAPQNVQAPDLLSSRTDVEYYLNPINGYVGTTGTVTRDDDRSRLTLATGTQYILPLTLPNGGDLKEVTVKAKSDTGAGTLLTRVIVKSGAAGADIVGTNIASDPSWTVPASDGDRVIAAAAVLGESSFYWVRFESGGGENVYISSVKVKLDFGEVTFFRV